MLLAIGTYVSLLDKDGAYQAGFSWQNFHQQESRSISVGDPPVQRTYEYAGFGYSGGSIDLQTASIEATLQFSSNQLDISIFQQASDDRMLAEVRTVWLNNDTLNEEGDFLLDYYTVLGFSTDMKDLNVRLGSPDDAVSGNFPKRVLTTALVGILPSTGNLPLT